MFPYSTERFTKEQEDLLSPYVTDTSGPVFALVNLDEAVKGALFARYSRSSKSLRRLFLDEFAGDLTTLPDNASIVHVGAGRALQLYDRVFTEYGDDSVAQLGGVHLACEQASNILTKLLERGRIMSYLEQSTRYIPYDSRLTNGRYRYYRDPSVLASNLGAAYVAGMDSAFEGYHKLIPLVEAFLAKKYPNTAGESDVAHRRALKAKALDLLRGLLPAGSLSNVGIYGSGQAYEKLVLRLRSSALPEANYYAELILEQLKKVIPSFLTRLDRPDRGGRWQAYIEDTRKRTMEEVAKMSGSLAATVSRKGTGDAGGPTVRLVDFDPSGEDRVIEAIIFESSTISYKEAREMTMAMDSDSRASLIDVYAGNRGNRRHRPGRAFEATSYTFEIVSDYGAFRDLQRHRLLTIEWQQLSPELGYDVPEEIDEAGLRREYIDIVERSRALYLMMSEEFPVQAPYALPLASKIRYVMGLNAREAMHLIELRSMPQGHESYRNVSLQMHDLIRDAAGHKALAAAMSFVYRDTPALPRMLAERRAVSSRSEASTT
ncbi:MAG: FAD-dependent thymidylate synthase [Actinobacteria bacterium]|nr:FAD-dependent thymidylate synthase [Actinomycetota bacterium]